MEENINNNQPNNMNNSVPPVQPNPVPPVQPNLVPPVQSNPVPPVQPNPVSPVQPNPVPPVQPNPVPPVQSNPVPPVQPGSQTQFGTMNQQGYNTQYNGNVWGTGNYNNYNNYNNQYTNNGFNQNKPKSSNGLKVVALILLVVLVGFLVLNFKSGKSSSASPHKNTDYERTIMIYMVGADLESNLGLASLDLNGLDYNKLKNENTKVIVIAGGTSSWKNNYIDINSTSIYELTESGYKVVKKQDKKNMGESSVLSDFLNYGFDNYKSKKYDLMFWNHGLGVLGSEHDQLSNDFLTLKEIKTAFNNSRFSSKNKLELVLFRTCLNGTIEVADTLKDYSNYMVASQEITLGYSGNNVLKTLNSTVKSDDGKKIGTKFADGYMNYIQQYINSSHVYSGSVYSTYSVLDLSKVSELESSLGDFFSDISVSNNYNQIARTRSTLKQYGSTDLTYDSVDLYNLVYNLKSLSPSKGQKVLDALNKVIVYNVSSDSRSKGLSIYFPYNGEKSVKERIINEYYDFKNLDKYKSFITTFNTAQSNGNASISFMDNKVSFSSNKKKTKSDFSIELTDDQKKNFAKAGYIVFRKEKDGTFVPVYSSTEASLDGNSLSASVTGKQLKVVDKKDKSESVISLIEKEETDSYIRYEAYPILEDLSSKELKDWLIQTAKMDIYLNKKDGKVTIGSVFVQPQNTKNKTTDSKSIVSEPYNVAVDYTKYSDIIFNTTGYKILDSKGNYIENWDSNGKFTGFEAKTKDINLQITNLNNKNDYYAVFKIWDVNNKVYYSKLVKMK